MFKQTLLITLLLELTSVQLLQPFGHSTVLITQTVSLNHLKSQFVPVIFCWIMTYIILTHKRIPHLSFPFVLIWHVCVFRWGCCAYKLLFTFGSDEIQWHMFGFGLVSFQSFFGSEFVAWLMKEGFCLNRQQAVMLGKDLLENDVIRHSEYICTIYPHARDINMQEIYLIYLVRFLC